MPKLEYEIRKCLSCGLRYPNQEGHRQGVRCPSCLGETRILLKPKLNLEPAHQLNPMDVSSRASYSVLLDNIRSAWNVGSIFRTADGFGFRHIYLCGITPTPDNPAVQKTSLGAENSVEWTAHKDSVELAKTLTEEGFGLIALEDSEHSDEIVVEAGINNRVLIVGNENVGVDPDLLALADRIFHIPMYGSKKSFNAATAFSIAAYALVNPMKAGSL